ncbi:MAG: hypothetical protein KDB27_05205 [Planctomycetales bacterium]|nr:hypothetical protein [Planctomycetales bacterium]
MTSNCMRLPLVALTIFYLFVACLSFAADEKPPSAESIGLEFIDTSFENASPLHSFASEKELSANNRF